MRQLKFTRKITALLLAAGLLVTELPPVTLYAQEAVTLPASMSEDAAGETTTLPVETSEDEDGEAAMLPVETSEAGGESDMLSGEMTEATEEEKVTLPVIMSGEAASDPAVVDAGLCASPTVEWTYYEDGTLVVEGSGEILDYTRNHPWGEYISSIKKAVLRVNGAIDLNNLFVSHPALTEVDLSQLQSDSVQNMGGMFAYCTSLKTVNFGDSFSTENVTAMRDMFYWCCSLETLDLRRFNTATVEEMSYMFGGCTSLKSLDLSNFDMASVTNGENMFSECSGLESIKTPLNLSVSVQLPTNVSQDVWRDAGGNYVSSLPCGMDTSITLSAGTMAGCGFTGQHYTLKNDDGSSLELCTPKDPTWLGEKVAAVGTKENWSFTVVPDEGYTIVNVALRPKPDFSNSIILTKGNKPGQYIVSAKDGEAGYVCDEVIDITAVPVGNTNLTFIYDSDMADVIVINGDTKSAGKPEIVTVSNTQDTNLYIKLKSTDGGEAMEPVAHIELVSATDPNVDAYDDRFSHVTAVQSDTEMTDEEKTFAAQGYSILRLGRIYKETPVYVTQRYRVEEDCIASDMAGKICWVIDKGGNLKLKGRDDGFFVGRPAWLDNESKIVTAEVDWQNATTNVGYFLSNCVNLKRADLRKLDIREEGVTELFRSGMVEEIVTPDHLDARYHISLPDYGKVWRTQDGTQVTEFPTGSESIAISNRLRVVTFSGEHFLLKDGAGRVINSKILMIEEGTTEKTTFVIEPENGYTVRMVTPINPSDFQAEMNRVYQGDGAARYELYPRDASNGFFRDEAVFVETVPAEVHNLNIDFDGSGVEDIVVVNGESAIGYKGSSNIIANPSGDKDTSICLLLSSRVGGDQIPTLSIFIREYTWEHYAIVPAFTDPDAMNAMEKQYAAKGYFVFRLGKLAEDLRGSVDIKTLCTLNISAEGFKDGVSITQYSRRSGVMYEIGPCPETVQLYSNYEIYLKVDYNKAAGEEVKWCDVNITSDSQRCSISKIDWNGSTYWEIRPIESANICVQFGPMRIPLSYMACDVEDLTVTGSHAALSTDMKAVELYGGDDLSISFGITDNIVLESVTCSTQNIKYVQGADGRYTVTIPDMSKIREIGTIYINTKDTLNRIDLSDPELQLVYGGHIRSYFYTGKPIEPSLGTIKIVKSGDKKAKGILPESEYRVFYHNNVEVGTAEIEIWTVPESRTYRGSRFIPFEINKCKMPAQTKAVIELEIDQAGTARVEKLSELFTINTGTDQKATPLNYRIARNECDLGGVIAAAPAPAITGDTLSYSIRSDATEQSEAASLIIYASFKNYEDAKLELIVQVVKKKLLVLGGTFTIADKVYDGEPGAVSAEGITVVSVDGKTVSASEAEAILSQIKNSWEYTYTGVDGTIYTSDQKPVNAGSYVASASVSWKNREYKSDSIASNKFVISPREAEITADDLKLYLDDTVPQRYGYHVEKDGLVEGDYIEPEPELACASLNVKESGQYPIKISVEQVNIYNADENNVTSNYKITGKNGIAEVLAPAPGSCKVIYNLSSHGADIVRSGIEVGKLLEKPMDPIAEGFVFLGWYKDDTYKVLWDFGSDIVTGDLVLYAGWAAAASDGIGSALCFGEITVQQYTGKALKPAVAVYAADGRTPLKLNKDYKVSYKNNIMADTSSAKYKAQEIPAGGIGVLRKDGTIDTSNGFDSKLAYAVITGKGNYTGTVCINFHIAPADIAAKNSQDTPAKGFVLKYMDQFEEKNNKSAKIVTSLKYKKALTLHTDYTLEVADAADGTPVNLTQKGELPLKSGAYKMLIKGQGNYSGTIEKDIYVASKDHLMKYAQISYAKAISDVTKAQLESGVEQSGVTVTVGGDVLGPDDYTVSYSGNHEIGTAVMTVKGTGLYRGAKSVSFKINGLAFNEKAFESISLSDMDYNGTAITQNDVRLIPVGKSEAEALQYGTDYIISYKSNIKNGKAVMQFTAIPSSGYSGSFKKKFTIRKLVLEPGTLAMTGTEQEGNTVRLSKTVPYRKGGTKPSDRFGLYVKDTNFCLKEGRDYTIRYYNNTAVTGAAASAYMVIKGKGNFSGELTIYFGIGEASLYQLFESGSLTITASGMRRRKISESQMEKEDYVEPEYTPSITVKDGKKTLQKDIEFEVTYYNNSHGSTEGPYNINPYAEIRGIGVYGGIDGKDEDQVVIVPLSIYSHTISAATIYILYEDGSAFSYTGNQIRPQISVYYGKEADVAKAKRNKETDEDTLTEPKEEIDSEDGDGEPPEYHYGLTKLSSWNVESGGDYILTYGTNVFQGKNGKIVVKGVGSCTGTVNLSFMIGKKQIYNQETNDSFEE